MKCISCFLLTMLLGAGSFCIALQPAQQGTKQKVEAADSKTAKTPQGKVPVANTAPEGKQKQKKETAAEDPEFLGPLSWRPGLIY
jgi:hypothetical protein